MFHLSFTAAFIATLDNENFNNNCWCAKQYNSV